MSPYFYSNTRQNVEKVHCFPAMSVFPGSNLFTLKTFLRRMELHMTEKGCICGSFYNAKVLAKCWNARQNSWNILVWLNLVFWFYNYKYCLVIRGNLSRIFLPSTVHEIKMISNRFVIHLLLNTLHKIWYFLCSK